MAKEIVCRSPFMFQLEHRSLLAIPPRPVGRWIVDGWCSLYRPRAWVRHSLPFLARDCLWLLTMTIGGSGLDTVPLAPVATFIRKVAEYG